MAGHPSSTTKPFRLSTNLKRDIRCWSRLWGLPSLSQKVTVRFNGRLRTTVARLLSDIDVIEVGPRFIVLRSKRREILCHELAHAAASRRDAARLDLQFHDRHRLHRDRARGMSIVVLSVTL